MCHNILPTKVNVTKEEGNGGHSAKYAERKKRMWDMQFIYLLIGKISLLIIQSLPKSIKHALRGIKRRLYRT
jgi:hypothetical protein